MKVKVRPGSILFVAAALALMLAAPALAGLYIPDAFMPPFLEPEQLSFDLQAVHAGAAAGFVADFAETEAETADEGELDEPTVTVFNVDAGRVMTLGLEEYLIGVVAGEMPVSFGEEALKAQAVAARSYAIYRISRDSQYIQSHGGAQLCTDSGHCKAYVTREKLAAKWGEETADSIFEQVTAAVLATRGEILTYEGEVALAVFHSSSDGVTESAEAVWGRHVPYLVSVETPEETEPQVAVFTRGELVDLLAADGVKFEDTALPVLVHDDAGRVASVAFGDVTVPGTRVREALGLRSTDFSLVILDGEYIFTARGYGHGVGMSQYGAAAMAAEGNSYREILAHYYPGTELVSLYDYMGG
ncbi:MAG: stage II sporulation protein D [Clostridiales bacterium]|jgi:stage II sporulation protein D|nr:stage II sporulation protein D [Clostridiales bacterium]